MTKAFCKLYLIFGDSFPLHLIETQTVPRLMYVTRIFLPNPFWWLVIFLASEVSSHICNRSVLSQTLQGTPLNISGILSLCVVPNFLVFKLQIVNALTSSSSKFCLLNANILLAFVGLPFPCVAAWKLSSSRKLGQL